LQDYDWSHAAEAYDIGKLFVKGSKQLGNLVRMLKRIREGNNVRALSP